MELLRHYETAFQVLIAFHVLTAGLSLAFIAAVVADLLH
jgi:hypothetical protein